MKKYRLDSWENIERLLDAPADKYTVIVTADHGGHDRIHGTEMPEDMTIPLVICGAGFDAGTELKDVSIKDIAPTITDILGVRADGRWEGKSLAR